MQNVGAFKKGKRRSTASFDTAGCKRLRFSSIVIKFSLWLVDSHTMNCSVSHQIDGSDDPIFLDLLVARLVEGTSCIPRRTDRPTDGPTDQRTDRPSYRDARTHLKTPRSFSVVLSILALTHFHSKA